MKYFAAIEDESFEISLMAEGTNRLKSV